jgi:hypothetical protein
MNLMQKIRNPLHSVDDDPTPEAARNEALEALRIRREIIKELRLQQIDIDRVWESGSICRRSIFY